MQEKWKPIPGYEDYEVSDEGRVRSFWYGRIKVLSPGINNRGYYRIDLYKNGKRKQFLVHRLVVEAFRGPIPKGKVVNHLNENQLDNRLSNLEVVTQKENVNWGTRNERASKTLKGNTYRARQLDLMLAEYPYTEFTFSSSYEASEFFGYQNQSQVGAIIAQARKRGENWINLRRKKYFFSQAS